MLRRIIIEHVASMMVLPNKLPIQLSDIVEAAELKAPEPEVSSNIYYMVSINNIQIFANNVDFDSIIHWYYRYEQKRIRYCRLLQTYP